MPADDEDRRAVLCRRRLALRARLDLDEGAGGRLDDLAVDLEGRLSSEDDVELLLPGFAEWGFVVLADDATAGGRAERLDSERFYGEGVAEIAKATFVT